MEMAPGAGFEPARCKAPLAFLSSLEASALTAWLPRHTLPNKYIILLEIIKLYKRSLLYFIDKIIRGIYMSFELEKELVGKHAAELVEDGQVIGVGSGTTVSYFIKHLGARCRREGLKILAVPSSYQSYFELIKAGVALTTLDEYDTLDLTIDGADEVDEDLNLIKGGGGALTQEKIIGTYTKKLIILVDSSKFVKRIGGAPIPVEVLPKALSPVYKKIESFGGKPEVRMAKRKLGPVVTDNGNFILDCKFEEIIDPESLNTRIKMLPGVVETGLFIGLADRILIGKEGAVIEKVKERARPDLNR